MTTIETMKVLHARNGNILRRWPVAVALACLPLISQAQGAITTTTAVERFMRTLTGANQTTVAFGATGTPVVVSAGANLAPDGGSGVKVTQSGSVPNPAGNPATVTATSRVSNAAISQVLSKLNTAGLLLTVGSASYALTQELLYAPKINADGSTDKTAAEKLSNFYDCSSTQVAGGSCYFYNIDFGTSEVYRRPTHEEMCQLWRSLKGWGSSSYRVDAYPPNTFTNQPGWQCRVIHISSGSLSAITDNTLSGAGNAKRRSTATTWQAFLDEVATKSGWPASSNVAKAAVDAATRTGTKLQPDPVSTVTGPAQTDGKTSTRTSTNPDGSTRTESTVCKYNHTYSGSNISTSEACTTTVTNDGEIGKTTSETETKTPEKQAEEKPVEGCEKDPLTLGCLKLDTPPEADIPKSEKTVSYATEDLGWGSGQCPASPSWSDSLGTHTLDLGPICDAITSWVRPLVLAFAALMALAIAMPVVKGAD